jgi:hypothetical protein
MTDPSPNQPAEASPPLPDGVAARHCSWCSAVVADAAATTCPSCGAALLERVEGDVPGVTQIDAARIATKAHLRTPGMRAYIGLTDEDTEGAPRDRHVEPPSEDVRKEMLRLKMAALEAELEAAAAALAAEQATMAANVGRAARPGASAVDAPEAAEPPADAAVTPEPDAAVTPEPDGESRPAEDDATS